MAPIGAQRLMLSFAHAKARQRKTDVGSKAGSAPVEARAGAPMGMPRYLSGPVEEENELEAGPIQMAIASSSAGASDVDRVAGDEEGAQQARAAVVDDEVADAAFEGEAPQAAPEPVQAKCATCESARIDDGSTEPVQLSACPECDASTQIQAELDTGFVQLLGCDTCDDADPVQGDDGPRRGSKAAPRRPRAIHGAAKDGLVGASSPLPHVERIQASFGHHDISNVQTNVGGRARSASQEMGASAYASGSRIAFRSEPDLRLAAHEAAHVVQQAAGVELERGVGKPGDTYERQADEVADAVVRGESAEPILDRTVGTPAPATAEQQPDASVQHELHANATRLFEPPVAGGAGPMSSESSGGGTSGGGEEETSGGGGASTDSGATAEGDASSSEPNQSQSSTNGMDGGMCMEPDSGGMSVDTSGGSSGGGSPSGSTTDSSSSAADSQPTCSATGTATCYTEGAEAPERDPESRPPDPQPPETQTDARGDAPDIPEPDNCPVEAALLDQSMPQQTAGGDVATAADATTGGATEPGSTPAGGPEGSATDSAGGGGGGGGGGGEPGGGAGGGEPAASAGLDAAVATAEGQRNTSVAAYAASTTALTEATLGISALRRGVRFVIRPGMGGEEATRRTAASDRATRFFVNIAGQLDSSLAWASVQLPQQLGEQAEARNAQIAQSIDTEKQAISARIVEARTQANTDATTARTEVMLAADATASAALTQTSAAIEILNQAHTDTLVEVDSLETSTLGEVNEIYEQGRRDHESRGTKVGGEAVARGGEFANDYERCRHQGPENTFWSGDLRGARADAQKKAARDTADGYRSSFVDAAKKRGRDMVKAGRKEDRCAVIAAARTARNTLDQQHGALVGALERARDATIQQAQSLRDTTVSSIDAALRSTLAQLDRQEHDQRQAVNDTGYMQQLAQEQMAHAAVASIQRTVVDAVNTAQSALASVQARLNGAEAPDLGELTRVLQQVRTTIEAALGGLNRGADAGATRVGGQLGEAGQQGIDALVGITRSNGEAATAASAGFLGTVSGISSGAVGSLVGMQTSITRQAQDGARNGSEALRNAVAGMRQTCTSVTSQATSKLGQSADNLESSLRERKAGLECDIPERALQAAASVPPAWKKVLAVVLIILVIVIVIAAIVLTGGAATPLAAIVTGAIVGAVVGAVTAALIQIAGNLWTNQDWTKGVAKAAAIGFVTGAIGGGIGAWAGAAVKGMSTAVQFGVTLGVNIGLDVATQVVLGGFSFKDFSLKQLGLTVLITIVTFGIGHYVGSRAGAGKGGESPEATTTPHETPTTTPAGETPTTTPHETPTTTPHETPTTTPAGETPTTTPHETPTTTPAGETPTTTPHDTPTTTPHETPTTTPAGETPTTTPAGETPTTTPHETPTTTPAGETPPTTPAGETPTTTPAGETPTTTPHETPTTTPHETPTTTPHDTPTTPHDTPTTTPHDTPTTTPHDTPTTTPHDTPTTTPHETTPPSGDTTTTPAPGDAATPSGPRSRVIRQDDDFNALQNSKGVPKSRIDADGSIRPADPNGSTTPLEHIYGSTPAKDTSPYTSFMTEEGGVGKSYGSHEVEVDIGRLRADIESGKVPGVEVVTPEQLQSRIRADIEQVSPGLNADAAIASGPAGIDPYLQGLGLSKGKIGKLSRRLLALFNTSRDKEWLIKGVIPPEYLRGPYPVTPP
jgi:hypothetical protein